MQAAKRYDTWVIGVEHDREPIERYLAKHGPIDGLTFHFVPVSAIGTRLERSRKTFYLGYNLWHRRAYRLAQQLHERHHFDITSLATVNGYREPGYLYKLGVPFVWGPVGGTQNYPWRFLKYAGFSGAITESLRNLVNSWQLRTSIRARRAGRVSSRVLAASSTIRRDLHKLGIDDAEQILETGLPSKVSFAPRRHGDRSGPLRLLWIGAIEPRKALPVLLEAMAQAPSHLPMEVTVIGRGKSLRGWQKLAARLGIGNQCHWRGVVDHGEALAAYRDADVFVFTSLRDTSGNVVLEALASGLPVVCFDHQGVSDMVTAECGIKVPVTNPAEGVAGFREALTLLASDVELRQRLGEGASQRAQYYHWDKQGERFNQVYGGVLGMPEPAAPTDQRVTAGTGRLQSAPLQVTSEVCNGNL